MCAHLACKPTDGFAVQYGSSYGSQPTPAATAATYGQTPKAQQASYAATGQQSQYKSAAPGASGYGNSSYTAPSTQGRGTAVRPTAASRAQPAYGRPAVQAPTSVRPPAQTHRPATQPHAGRGIAPTAAGGLSQGYRHRTAQEQLWHTLAVILTRQGLLKGCGCERPLCISLACMHVQGGGVVLSLPARAPTAPRKRRSLLVGCPQAPRPTVRRPLRKWVRVRARSRAWLMRRGRSAMRRRRASVNANGPGSPASPPRQSARVAATASETGKPPVCTPP
jgi:hypothetical protein